MSYHVWMGRRSFSPRLSFIIFSSSFFFLSFSRLEGEMEVAVKYTVRPLETVG